MNCVLHINLLRELMAFHLMTRKCSAIARNYLRPLHTTHKTEKVFLKSCCENRCPYVKLLKTSLQRKKAVVCMEDKCIFCSFICNL